MRTIGRAALVLAFVALSPAIASAQAGRAFTDSWFWGAKAGALSFSTTRIENGFAPSVGTEWLITRNRGALYISLDRAFFSEESTINDSQSLTGTRVVNVKDLTRLGFSLMAFPKNYDGLRPYGGVGLALNFIQEASPADGNNDGFTDAVIAEESSRASFQLLAGVQKELRAMSLFGQVVMLPFESGFLLNSRAGFALEVGVRWNMGTAIK